MRKSFFLISVCLYNIFFFLFGFILYFVNVNKENQDLLADVLSDNLGYCILSYYKKNIQNKKRIAENI